MESEITRINQALKSGSVTCTELIGEKLRALENNSSNTANFILNDLSISMARRVDEKIKEGAGIGLLEGVPFGLKDVYLLQGCNASGSSAILQNYISPYTATAIQKLLDAGAIPVVKENCDCFGHGSSSENTIFGPVRNAINEDLVAGGSSGGSAVNVAKGYTAFSIGGDTGGSVRQPAGFNRVYGLKPTYGRISRFGLMAYASSTDCVGPIARNIEDIRILLNAMSGKDSLDNTTIESNYIPETIFSEKINENEFRVGYYRNFIESNDLDPGIRKDFKDVLELLRERGVTIQELEFFDPSILVSTYYVLAMAETASNLARLDGTAYGERVTGGSIREDRALTRSQYFTRETKRRIVGGTQVLSHGYSEGIYQKARLLCNQIKGSFTRDFQNVNVIISPVTPNAPPQIGKSLDNPLVMYLSDAYTVGFSLGGLPALTVPLVTATGLQISADKNREGLILKFAKFLNDLILSDTV
jgi:aspartyl-tRNA(Asn)/glutamyl-tRNA(Gln) amidotransferase subunit A